MKPVKIIFYFLLATVLFNACRKEYSLEGSSVKLPVGTWEFKDSLKQFQGNMDTAYISSTAGSTTKLLTLNGTSADGSQSFHLHLFSDIFKTGSYKASLFESSFEYSTSGKIIYNADQFIGEFIVNITSFGNNNITGTFSGIAIDSAGNFRNLSQGKFTSSIGTSGTNASSGVLGDSSGNCKPVTLAGTYLQGVALTSANTVQVQVTVAAVGTYSITSNAVNGVSFAKTGTFTSVGVQNIILNGTGTPSSSGNQNFIIKYGNSQCGFKISFGVPATGSLGGGGGSCTPFTLAGIYKQGVLLNSSNTVQIQVNVTTPGSYNIITNTVNGVSFFKSGTFASTGIQTITLTGSGTPFNAGLQTFAVSFGTSICNFSITFAVSAMPSGDYFPTTANSNWTYGLVGGTPSDSVHTAIIGYSPAIGGKTYKTIAAYDVPPATAFDSAYYRKPGGDYYQYSDYSNLLPFDAPILGEFIFLKDNVALGTTWQSPTVSGTFVGAPVTGFIKMTLLAKAIPVTIATFNFPDVIKVKYEYFLTGIPVAIETDERWFARNVGEIHDSISDGTFTDIYDIGSYQIF
ncbi:MAG: hypothetical protein ABI834_00635 [Ginsengibacter sp.]